jgi:hypothetical protein
MRAFALLLVAALFPSGCVVDELTAPHVSPGGAVHAALAGGVDHQCTALADGKNDPFTVSGSSPVLTFGLVGATDANGARVLADVQQQTPLASIDVPLAGASMLEIHLDGSGCVGQSGEIHLHVDANGKLQGDFAASGVLSGSTAPCQFAGTLVDIPLDR